MFYYIILIFNSIFGTFYYLFKFLQLIDGNEKLTLTSYYFLFEGEFGWLIYSQIAHFFPSFYFLCFIFKNKIG